jgi:hypothetical protein
MGIDSENDLFRKLPKTILAKIVSQFNEFEDYFVVDSMPLEICKLSRSSRSKICKENAYAFLDKDYCTAQNSNYYGYKLHAVCSVNGVFQSIDLSPASVHDINYLKCIKIQICDCTLIGDRGDLSVEIQLNLFETCNIRLTISMRSSQKKDRKQPNDKKGNITKRNSKYSYESNAKRYGSSY